MGHRQSPEHANVILTGTRIHQPFHHENYLNIHVSTCKLIFGNFPKLLDTIYR